MIYQYATLSYGWGQLAEELNRWAEDGWEVVSASQPVPGLNYEIILRRERKLDRKNAAPPKKADDSS